MTIELSLRRRAIQCRYFAILWLSLAVIILVGTYFTLPYIAGKTLDSVNQIERGIAHGDSTKTAQSSEDKSFLSLHVFALTTLALGMVAISCACYLLGRCAFMELDSAERARAMADALCISGNDFPTFEKAVSFLVPKSQFLSNSKLISAEDLKDFAEVLKKVR